MTVVTVSFVGFALIAAALHEASPSRRWRALVMLVFNLLLLASFATSPLALLPLGMFLIWGFVCTRAAPMFDRQFFLLLPVTGTVLLFCWIKKYWFLSAVAFLPFPYLALGLSYVFFRVLGLIFDCRSGVVAKVNPVDYFNFAVNFPSLTAGPIDRYRNFFAPSKPVTMTVLGRAAERIIVGFFKVLVVSHILSNLQDGATELVLHGPTERIRLLNTLASFGLYPLFLYFNFSGYTDIVIALGRLFGNTYPENFNAPFASLNFIEFWSRWHMSLSLWLRDYVFTPLLMVLMERYSSRLLDPILGALAYSVTFFLIGIWHGSTAIFVIYGLALAAGVTITKLYQSYLPRWIGKPAYRRLCEMSVYRFVSRGLTFTFFAFSMICFWANVDTALALIHTVGAAGMIASFVALLAVATVGLNAWELGAIMLTGRLSPLGAWAAMPYLRAIQSGALVVACLGMAVLTRQVDADIIYQAF